MGDGKNGGVQECEDVCEYVGVWVCGKESFEMGVLNNSGMNSLLPIKFKV